MIKDGFNQCVKASVGTRFLCYNEIKNRSCYELEAK